MRAAHWVRSRQEERELAYWLALAFYDPRDRSLNNRIYLIYLILFFSIWTFITLTFFASGGAFILGQLAPGDPARAALFVEVLLLGQWSACGFWQAAKRSPVVFSDQDSYLICQTPVNRWHVTLRWLPLPWLRSAVPFWLAAVTLGFSVAETSMPGAMSASRIGEYAAYGFRAWMAVIPVHLALYALQWAAGISRLHKDVERRGRVRLAAVAAAVFFAFLLMFTTGAGSLAAYRWGRIAGMVLYPLSQGFAHSHMIDSLLIGGLFALASLAWMTWRSEGFSLSRAAEETREIEVIKTAVQYGFASYAEQLKMKQRLGQRRAPSRLPAISGPSVLVWKDLLQSQRSFRFAALAKWLGIFSVMLSYSFLPDFGSRVLATVFWVILIGQVSVVRVRSDLACWSLMRQLPISNQRYLLVGLSPVYLLAVLASVIGLILSAIIFRTPLGGLVVLIPGMAAITVCMAVFDVIRRSRSDLLLTGSVPELSAGGIFLGLIVAAVPVLVDALVPGAFGLVLAALLSVGLGILAYSLAVHSFRYIDTS